MTDSRPPFSDDAAHEERRQRRQERLYVGLQTVGWMLFFGMQLFFMRILTPAERQGSVWLDGALILQVALIGWLLTHYARPFMHRWGWRRLGGVPLVARVFGMALALSLAWSLIGYGVQHFLLRQPAPSQYPLPMLMLVSLVNGTFIMGVWLALYFTYHVFDRFNSSEIERLRLGASVKEAELRALKAQVNPHFMFNALNSVRALIDEDPVRARQAVTQLANLLRYSLQAGSLETVAFEDELQVVNDYLALEQVRHEERLRLRIDVSPEALQQVLPPMLLQTLVENAVKYGVSNRPQGGEIGIRARVRGDQLELCVANSGSLERVQASGRTASSTGLGLQNALNRLRLLFGDRATLVLRQESPDQVVAEVTIPLGERDRDLVATPPRPGALHLRPQTAP